MRVYLAGPMRGYRNFNFPAFDAAAAKLREKGHEVFSPAERDRMVHGPNLEDNATGDEDEAAKKMGFSLREALAADLEWICHNAEAIALLPGWEQSRGARAEYALAQALGLVELGLAGTEFYVGGNKAAPEKVTATVTPLHPRRPLPGDAGERKLVPLCTGLLDYFPDALAVVAHVSYVGNQQHNPGEPLHWARGKSTDEADALMRHLVARGTRDTDGLHHLGKVAWRVLAMLQKDLEQEYKLPLPRGCKAAA